MSSIQTEEIVSDLHRVVSCNFEAMVAESEAYIAAMEEIMRSFRRTDVTIGTFMSELLFALITLGSAVQSESEQFRAHFNHVQQSALEANRMLLNSYVA